MWKLAVSGAEKVRIRTNSKLLAYPLRHYEIGMPMENFIRIIL